MLLSEVTIDISPRNAYFTHLRDDIIKGNLMTDPSTAALLSALILQGNQLLSISHLISQVFLVFQSKLL